MTPIQPNNNSNTDVQTPTSSDGENNNGPVNLLRPLRESSQPMVPHPPALSHSDSEGPTHYIILLSSEADDSSSSSSSTNTNSGSEYEITNNFVRDYWMGASESSSDSSEGSISVNSQNDEQLSYDDDFEAQLRPIQPPQRQGNHQCSLSVATGPGTMLKIAFRCFALKPIPFLIRFYDGDVLLLR